MDYVETTERPAQVVRHAIELNGRIRMKYVVGGCNGSRVVAMGNVEEKGNK
jgi:hypothetical protein